VTALDWGIVAFTLALAVWGYQQGLIVGALTLAGFAGGAFIGSRLAPALLTQGAKSPYAPLLAALGALVLGALVAVTFEGFALGLRARLIRGQTMHVADGAGGAMLVATVGLGIAWVFGAVALHAPGATQLRRDVQTSVILQRLNDVLPPTGPILNVLNRVDPSPTVNGPLAPVGPPNPRIAQDPQVQQAGESVVKVTGTACGLGVEGSGWMAAPGLVVTNAHVVAGESDTTVQTLSGASVNATPVHYDPRNDLALLRVPVDLAPLAIARSPKRGEEAAVLGYPENGPFTVTPARFGSIENVISQDAYGRGPINRRMVSLRGMVRSGNSGGPAVDPAGRVLATVFAATTGGGSNPGGFGVPNGVVRAALRDSSTPVGTGPCTG
jgi:S1-C subfamily serine protease